MGVHTDVYLCVVQSQNLLFQGQQQQKQPVITPPVSSKGVWCLAALSGVTVCLDVFPCRTHTHTERERASKREREGPAAGDRQLLCGCCQPVQHTALYPTLIFIYFLPLPPNLDMAPLKRGQNTALPGWWGHSDQTKHNFSPLYKHTLEQLGLIYWWHNVLSGSDKTTDKTQPWGRCEVNKRKSITVETSAIGSSNTMWFLTADKPILL